MPADTATWQKPGTDGQDRQFVTALARGLELLRCFTPDEAVLGNRQLASRTGLPPATVSRLTHTLCELGYLEYSEGLGKYRLGPPVLSLGYACLRNLAIRQRARELMARLAEDTGASVAMGARDRLEMVYVEHCHAPELRTLRLDVGSRIPLATTSLGRALLAGLPEAERNYLLEHIRQRDPDNWPQLAAGIERAVEEVTRRGFCLVRGEWQRDVNAVGVPLVPGDGSPIVALNCGGPEFSLPVKRLEQEVGPRLVHLAHSLGPADHPPFPQN